MHKKLWKITSDSGFNSVAAYKAGLVLNSDSGFLPEGDKGYYAVGTFKACRALASFTRWHWINVNGYNAIRITRFKSGALVYDVLPHFGSNGYNLLKIKPYTDAPDLRMTPRLPDTHRVVCYKSGDGAPVLLMGETRTIRLNRAHPLDSTVVEIGQHYMLARARLGSWGEFEGNLYRAATADESRAFVALAESFLPVNLFLA